MRLIDAETMKNSLCEPCCRNEKCSTIEECRKIGCGMMSVIDHQPTIDAQPVRHGHWMFLPQKNGYLWKCSKCKGNYDQQYSFCPHCGAKMDGVEYDDDGSGVGQTFSPD